MNRVLFAYYLTREGNEIDEKITTRVEITPLFSPLVAFLIFSTVQNTYCPAM